MISDDLLVPAVLGSVVLVLVILLVIATVALRRERARSDARLESTREESARLRDRVDTLARQIEVRPSPEGFVITDIGREESTSAAPEPADRAATQRIEGKLFVDLVMRESVVKAASLTHGVRRALAPATRNRIRFAMKQEIKRSRKERRIELREVRREMAARRAARGSAERGPSTDGSAEDVA